MKFGTIGSLKSLESFNPLSLRAPSTLTLFRLVFSEDLCLGSPAKSHVTRAYRRTYARVHAALARLAGNYREGVDLCHQS